MVLTQYGSLSRWPPYSRVSISGDFRFWYTGLLLNVAEAFLTWPEASSLYCCFAAAAAFLPAILPKVMV
jgi:hypothetical protein